MQYSGEFRVEFKTVTFSDEAFEIKLAAIQRELWRNFGAGAVMRVEYERRNSEEEVIEAYDRIFKPGENLEEL